MTSEDIRNHPGAAASSSGDTDSMCFWLKEIALQLALMNERGAKTVELEPLDPTRWSFGPVTPASPLIEPEILPAQPFLPPKVQYFSTEQSAEVDPAPADDIPF